MSGNDDHLPANSNAEPSNPEPTAFDAETRAIWIATGVLLRDDRNDRRPVRAAINTATTAEIDPSQGILGVPIGTGLASES
jgi:hypothetical protein